MPLVQVRYKSNEDITGIVNLLTEALPGIVATHLSVEGAKHHKGKVMSTDVVVEVNVGSPMDKNAMDIHIVIFAHNFPKRVVTAEQRKERIVNDIQKFLSRYQALDVFVWINLLPTNYGCF
jgi:hypothetical protein